MGRKTGDFNRYGHLEDEEAQAQSPTHEKPERDPLDHDGNGEKGGSQKGSKSTRSKGAAKAKVEEPAPAGDETPVAEVATETTDDSQTETQDEETPADAEETSTGEEVSE